MLETRVYLTRKRAAQRLGVHEQTLRSWEKRGSVILNLVEAAPAAEAFVTWNARHFQGKASLPVLTPTDYLRR